MKSQKNLLNRKLNILDLIYVKIITVITPTIMIIVMITLIIINMIIVVATASVSCWW